MKKLMCGLACGFILVFGALDAHAYKASGDGRRETNGRIHDYAPSSRSERGHGERSPNVSSERSQRGMASKIAKVISKCPGNPKNCIAPVADAIFSANPTGCADSFTVEACEKHLQNSNIPKKVWNEIRKRVAHMQHMHRTKIAERDRKHRESRDSAGGFDK